MGAFVSPKDTYPVIITTEDCPCLDREEQIDVQKGLTAKSMLAMQNAEGFDAGVVYLKESIRGWSFVDEKNKPVPLTDANIDILDLEIILFLLGVTQDKLPLANQAVSPETTTDP